MYIYIYIYMYKYMYIYIYIYTYIEAEAALEGMNLFDLDEEVNPMRRTRTLSRGNLTQSPTRLRV